MSPRRVVLAGVYPPPFAGEAVHMRQLAHFLRNREIDVEILNLVRGAPPSPEYRHFTGYLTFLRMLFRATQNSAIVHLHTCGHNWKSWIVILLVGLAARLKGALGILTIHSGVMPRYVRELSAVRLGMVRSALRLFTRIICVNQEIGIAMKELGIEETRIDVIPAFLGGTEPAILAPADEAVIGGFRPLLVVVGGGDPDPEAGLPVVVDSLPKLREMFPDVGALFIGWKVGPKTGPLIRTLGMTDYAVCLGEVSHERCLALLRRADVVVRSTFADGDAACVREAFAFGVPVVASDTDFRPEGTILFRKGDSADLLSKLIGVLGRGRGAPQSVPDQTGPSRQGLWRVYCEVGGIGRDGFQPSSGERVTHA